MTASTEQRSAQRYGAAGFLAAGLNVLLGNLAAWFAVPYFLLYLLFVPVIVVDLAVAAALVRRRGRSGQIGRGMLIGLISVPLAPAAIAAGYAIAAVAGLASA
ncbi:hypothetical protein BHQ15_11650 [Mycolicibacillus koreensis]|nr:hypothetical protein BHQ15_11650 [Mycolicibacillus koreensis]